MDSLNARGAIIMGNPKAGVGRGQPSPTVRLNPEFAFTAGISVNTDTIGTCLFDFAGNIRTSHMIDIVDTSRSKALDLVKSSIHRQVKSQNLRYERMFGTGFAIAGFLQEGTKFNTPLPLSEWSLIELGPLVSQLFDKPTWTGNSANSAAVCESMLGVGRFVSNFVYLSFNYGFGGAAIVNGELLRGGHGNAGELSAMFDELEMARRPALEFLANALRANGICVPSINYIKQNFDPSWPGVAEWIDDVSGVLNRVINAVYAVLDPHLIVFGGQIPRQLADLLIANTKFVRRPRYGRLMNSPKLVVSDLNEDASSVGAAAMPFKEIFF